jgi:protein phosphatase
MILADGMGGYEGGAVASSCAVETFMDTYHAAKGSAAGRLRQALQQTNQQLALEKQSKPKLANMGCTLVGVAIHDEKLEWISVGDSPLWLYNAGRLHRLNADNEMKPILQKQVQRGELSPKIAAAHPDRHKLRSAFTGGKVELIDRSSVPLKLFHDDRILLASDGIFTLSVPEISKILRKNLCAQKLVNRLLGAVRSKKYQYNATVLVVNLPNERDAR